MAVITNKNTQQTPVASGLTGAQSIKWIDCPRVYVKAVDSSPTPITTKSNGSTPGSYTDLGIVSGKAKITYTKDKTEIRTGIDNVLRQTFVKQKNASFEFTLSQFDDVVMASLSGLTPSTITAGSVYSFGVGSEDVVSYALLLVSQNKLDGKEWQFYSPNCDVTFNIQDNGDETVFGASGELKAFTFGGKDQYFVQTIFA